jgi:uncharacterized repeat protein (TIGR01451 family)
MITLHLARDPLSMSVRRVLPPALATAALLVTLSVMPALAGGFPVSDLAVTKNDTVDPVVTGGQITYAMTVTNNSTEASHASSTLTDSLPADAAFVSATASQGTCAYSGVLIHSVTCSLGSVAANGGTATVTIVVTAGPPGTYTNTVSVSQPLPAFDPDPNNNSDTEVTTVVAATPSPSPSPTPSPTPTGSSATPSPTPASATPTPLAAQLPDTVTGGPTGGALVVTVVAFLLSAGAFAVARLRSGRTRSAG